ncbi:MAG: hypothetical protein GXX83_02110 [Gaiellales bacterium]|nr:hypothetical protein [Gaiellales bacterium]
MANKYDPMWEYAGVKVPLQGTEPDVDAVCPVCHVRVHLGLGARPAARVECGLCGELLEIVSEGNVLTLRKAEAQ